MHAICQGATNKKVHSMTKFIGVNEAAKIKEVSASRIRQLCRDKRIRPVPKRVGRDWVIAANFKVIEAGRTRPGKIALIRDK